MDFSLFRKPSRYIDSELNAIRKGGNVTVRMGLCFPDVYEVGMSHLGLKILYDIVNRLSYAAAERVYAPWPDVEEYLRASGEYLASLETGRPLKAFDVVGFSLQYELSYTTVLNMLDLGGIPLLREERAEGAYPLVVAGGPCTVNPAPLAPFIDAFLIGDGEEAVAELAEIIRIWKGQGDGSRASLLREIAGLVGFFVPGVHTADCPARRRYIGSLDAAPFPVAPIVPYMSVVHDRVAIEVSRGCTMGCRFCQAGMIYRPLRDRSPDRVLKLVTDSLRNTGYEEVSFVSLSAGDYPHLLPLVREFNNRFGSSRVAVSLPSLRVATVNRDVLKEIRSVRKTGFTMAPEAATARLRSVINKDFGDEDYERALYALFEEGWQSLKLYFMVGLPTETEGDIEAIHAMAMRALQIAKRNTGRFVNISVTVSPFVPKSHTPFQWFGQIATAEMRRRLGYLRETLSRKKLKYKGHDERMSFLEAVFARGDEGLAPLLLKARDLGCRLDGWSEHFDFVKWQRAMDETGIDGTRYAERAFSGSDPLPWDSVDVGTTKSYLRKEYERAFTMEMTEDCQKTCAGCGLACKPSTETSFPNLLPSFGRTYREGAMERPKVRARVEFSKTGRLAFLSHLELVTAILRALRRAEVQTDFSRGFHPAPKVSFGPPLGVGTSGQKEYFDMEVITPLNAQQCADSLNLVLPEGLRVRRIAIIPMQGPSLTSFVSRYTYKLSGSCISPPELSRPLVVLRDEAEVDISACVENVRVEDGCGVSGNGAAVYITLRDRDTIKVRLGEALQVLFGETSGRLTVTRTALYGWKDGWKEPL